MAVGYPVAVCPDLCGDLYLALYNLPEEAWGWDLRIAETSRNMVHQQLPEEGGDCDLKINETL